MPTEMTHEAAPPSSTPAPARPSTPTSPESTPHLHASSPPRSSPSNLPQQTDGPALGGSTSAETSEVETGMTAGLPLSPMQNLPNWLMLNLVAPILLLAAAGGLVYWLDTVQPSARPPMDDSMRGRLLSLPAVDVVPVRTLASTGQKLHLKTDGTVVPFREVILATEVAGRIVEKSPKCETGKYVRKGDLLMKIDPTDYDLEVKRLERLRQQEYEALGEVDQEMVNTKRSMDLARTDIELQTRELKRRESLPDRFASQGEIDQARRALLQAEQQLVIQQNQLDLLKKRRIRLESSERLAAMELEASEINLQRTKITAPIDGVVVSEQAELNTFVARGSPVVTIEDTSKVEVAANLRSDQLYWVLNQKESQGSELDMTQLSGPANGEDRGYQLPQTPVSVQYKLSGRDDLIYRWKGTLVGYDGIGLDEATRTVPVRIVVDDPRDFDVTRDGELVQRGEAAIAGPTTLVRGMFVNLQLELDPAVDLVVLPSEALKPGNRVWQFVPNASVLDVSILPKVAGDPESSDSEIEAETKRQASSEQVATSESDDQLGVAPESDDAQEKTDSPANVIDDTDFDPSAWVPGELVVLQNVRPVDEFSIRTRSKTDSVNMNRGDAAASEPSQSWICEIPGTSLKDGSFVVVSPLGSLRSSLLPVRAPAKIVGPVPGVDSLTLSVASPTKENLIDGGVGK